MAPTPNDTARRPYQLSSLLKLRLLTRAGPEDPKDVHAELVSDVRRHVDRHARHEDVAGAVESIATVMDRFGFFNFVPLSNEPTSNARRTSKRRKGSSRRRSRRFRPLAANVVFGLWTGASTATHSFACCWSLCSPLSPVTQVAVMCSPDGAIWKPPRCRWYLRGLCQIA